jgi:hypothetical protein
MGISGGPDIIQDGLITIFDAGSTYLPINRNLLTYTDDLTNATWGKIRSQITASATTAPDGSNTAFAMNITDATGLVRLSRSIVSSSIAGGPYTFSVYVKQNTSTAQLLDLGIYNAPTTQGTEPSYNILNNFAITGSGGSSISRSVTSVGNGWYRVATTSTILNNSTWNLFFDIEAGTGTKVNGQGIYLWGPQFEYGTTATEYQPVNVTTRLWPDQINQSINGSLINNPAFNSANGGSIEFDGVNDYVNLTTNIQSGFTSASYEFICYPNLLPGIGNYYQLYIQENSTWIGLYNPSGIIAFGIDLNNGSGWFDNNGGFNTGARTTSILSANTFYYLVYSWNGSSISVYLNGVLESTVSTNQAINGRQNVNILGAGTTSRNIGSRFSGGGNNWIGKIPIVRFYNRALSASEILQNYNAQKSRFNL